MKYFIIPIVFLFLVTPVYAAKTVSGTVPVLQPLLPPPAGVQANYSHNVQYSGKTTVASGTNDQSSTSQSSNSSSGQAPIEATASFGGGLGRIVLLVVILILGMVAVAWVFKGRSKS